ncbi:MAG TPA: CIA30 family protein, partial [Candidatus Goldiibacteriota bacterium]|nr:CIA30 family protein [Candidatus Goldiibacteriota bacterium]
MKKSLHVLMNRYFLGLIAILIPVVAVDAATCTVNAGTLRQNIRGFGASSAWSDWGGNSAGNSWLVSNADMFFTTTSGIGLTMIRARINPVQSQWGSTAPPLQAARDRGVTDIFATAWTPPAEWKSNGAVDNQNGAYLLPQYYPNYANYLRDYVNYMKNSQNVTISAISPANEPDYQVSYDGCTWSYAQMRDFVKNNLGPTFQAAGLTTQIVVGESFNNDLGFINTSLADATARNYIFAGAVHFYGGGPYACPDCVTYGKEYWQTEKSNFTNYDNSMTHGLITAEWLHTGLVNASYNAFFYWWLASDQTNEGLTSVTLGVPKRFYTFGNFSKYIRPGFTRIDATASPATNVLCSAYKNAASTSFVIVAINKNTSATSVTFNLTGIGAGSFTPYITSSSQNLAALAAVAVSGNSFTYSLPAQSVISFVASGPAPTATFTPNPAWSRTFTPTSTQTPSSVLLDDMEDGNNTNNWGGNWYKYQGTNSTITPDPFAMTAGGMTGSAAYRAQITGTINDYGGMGTNLNASETAVDLSSYTAVEFWVMGNGGTYWFQFTQPSITDGDNFGVTFTAPATWTKVTVPINAAALSQRGFGAASTFTPGAIIALQWTSNSNGALDIR